MTGAVHSPGKGWHLPEIASEQNEGGKKEGGGNKTKKKTTQEFRVLPQISSERKKKICTTNYLQQVA